MAASTTTSGRGPETGESQTAVNEPSMEDILASIRRIIAEDQSNNLGRAGLGGLTRRMAAAASPTSTTQTAAEPLAQEQFESEEPATVEAEPIMAEHIEVAEHVYDTVEEPASGDFAQDTEAHGIRGASAELFDAHGLDSEPLRADPLPAAGPVDDLPSDSDALMSPAAGASITSSFQALAETVLFQDPGLVERVVRESMRPLLKSWLDDHLPSIVERLVRSEIERVARGGRGRNS